MPQRTLTTKDITWIHYDEPSNEELASFVREVDPMPVDAEFIVHDAQRPEVTVRSHYMLLLIHVPIFDKKHRVTSGTALYFVIGTKRLWTISYEPVVVIQKLMKEYEEAPDRLEDSFGETPMSLALALVNHINESSFRKIQRLSKHVEIAEDAVFQGNERKMVEEVAILTRDVLDFRRVLHPHVGLFNTPMGEVLGTEEHAQWHRLRSQTTQLWEMLQSLFDSTKELRDTNNSLLQHKENQLLRILTIYSIVAIPALMLINPFNPREDWATWLDATVFWSLFTSLIIILIILFTHFKRTRVL